MVMAGRGRGGAAGRRRTSTSRAGRSSSKDDDGVDSSDAEYEPTEDEAEEGEEEGHGGMRSKTLRNRRSSSRQHKGGKSSPSGARKAADRSVFPIPDTPGPGEYNVAESGPREHFGVAFAQGTRDQAAKVYFGFERVEFVQSPGPSQYNTERPAIRGNGFSFSATGKGDGDDRSSFIPPSDTPGPASYQLGTTLHVPAATFGQASTKQPRRYLGPGVNGGPPERSGEYVAPQSTLGPQRVGRQRAGPAFSFGYGERPITASAVEDASPIRRRLRMIHQAKVNRYKAKQEAKNKPQDSEYNWIHEYLEKSKPKKYYTPVLDGQDMPRAREFKQIPAVSFGAGDRFTEAQYQPQNPRSGHDTPGPVYDVPDMASISARSASRAGQTPSSGTQDHLARLSEEHRRAILDPIPGPGDYNLTLEARMEAMLGEIDREQESLIAEEFGSELSPLGEDQMRFYGEDEEEEEESARGRNTKPATTPDSQGRRVRSGSRSPSGATSSNPSTSPSRSRSRSPARQRSTNRPQSPNHGSPAQQKEQGSGDWPLASPISKSARPGSRQRGGGGAGGGGESVSTRQGSTGRLSSARSVTSTRTRASTARTAGSLGALRTSRSIGAMTSALTLKHGDIPVMFETPGVRFSSADKDDGKKLYAPGPLAKEFLGQESPGPGCVELKWDTAKQGGRSPELQFGGANMERNAIPVQMSDVGPAQFAAVNAMGKQAQSKRRNPSNVPFASSTRAQTAKLYVPGFDRFR